MSRSSPILSGRYLWILAGLYGLFVVVTVLLMLWARHWAIQSLGGAEARENWQQWREEAERQAGEGPVRRRPPVSNEPPMLILMRDQFATCLAGIVVIASVFFWSFAWFLGGALRTESPHVTDVSVG